MSSTEKNAAETTQSTDGLPTKTGNNIPKKLLAEMFLLIYNGGLWGHLSQECQDFGQNLLQEMMDNGVHLEAPKPIGLSLSLSQYLQIIGNTLNMKRAESDFWHLVIRIQYLMMSIEKDPLLAKKLQESTTLNNVVAEVFGD